MFAGSFAGAFSVVHGQAITHQGGYWLRYYNQTQLREKLFLHLEIDERRHTNPDRQAQLFGHVHLHVKPSPAWDVAVGVNVNRSNSMQNPSLAVPEWRPWQEVIWTRPLRTKTLQIRYRLDERFVRHNDNESLQRGYSFLLRHRFRAQLIVPVPSMPSLTFRMSDEIMLQPGHPARVFDQNRVFISLEKQLARQLSVEVGYLNILQSRESEHYYDRHIVRTTFHHRIVVQKASAQRTSP